MTAPQPRTIRMPESPVTERERLLHLRARYQEDHDRFSRPELARLRFLRWLYQTEKGSEAR
jgi:hypothetical protein